MKKTKIAMALLAATLLTQQANAQNDTAKTAQDATSRALPSPLPSMPFPSADWVGPVIGESADAPDWPLQKLLGLANDKSRIKIYGWIDGSGNYSTSKNTNVPVSYDIQPNSIQLDQAVLRIERQPNTVQTDHIDWGFRFSSVYGLDYRYTTAKGWFSNQYYKKNNLYGYDNVETYFMLYFPKVAQGMVLTIGRYISPPDIEAQLATTNYLFTHTVMFSYDPYTFTGANASIMLNRYWTLLFGVNAGSDNAPWTNSATPNGQAMVRWVSHNNNNSIWAGLNSIGPNEKYSNGKDDIQMAAGTWGHKFSKRVHMMTEAYYIWERDAARGGTASYGPVQYDAGGGPGAIIPGISKAVGATNYFQILLGHKDKSYISIRNDYLDDMNGWRTGYVTNYISHTIGYIHYFTNWLCIRPEIRYDYNVGSNSSVLPYDGGTKSNQFSAAGDIIVKF